MNRFRQLFLVLCLFAFSMVGCSQQSATNPETTGQKTSGEGNANWPTKPITFLVWSKAGSGVDVMARQAAKFLEGELGQSVVVENKEGGDGAIAMQALLSKPADGYTIGANTRSQMVSLNADLKGQINPEEFNFIAQVQGDPYVLVVLTESGIKTVDDLVKAANSNPNFAIGGFGANSAHSIFAEDLAEQAKMKLNWIPYKGGSEAVTQLLGGHINASLTNVGQVMEQVKAGKMTILGVSTKERMAELPDTPTFKELGYTDLDVTHWRGFYVKKDTPQEVIARLDEALKKLSENKEWQEYLAGSGLTNDFLPSEQTAKDVVTDLAKFNSKLNK